MPIMQPPDPQQNPGLAHLSAQVAKNPVQRQHIPRTAWRPNAPTPGTMSITRRRSKDARNGDYVIRVGAIVIESRLSTFIDSQGYPMCKICGHPYDHNGLPHTAYEADRAFHRKPPIRRGESLTGPDGRIYRWDGQIWYRL